MQCHLRYYGVAACFDGFSAPRRKGEISQLAGKPIISITYRGFSREVVPAWYSSLCITILGNPLRSLPGNIEDVPLIRHHARPAADTLVAHPVERVRLQPGGKNGIDHLLRRPVEHGTQKIVGELFPERPDILTPVGVLFQLAVFCRNRKARNST